MCSILLRDFSLSRWEKLFSLFRPQMRVDRSVAVEGDRCSARSAFCAAQNLWSNRERRAFNSIDRWSERARVERGRKWNGDSSLSGRSGGCRSHDSCTGPMDGGDISHPHLFCNDRREESSYVTHRKCRGSDPMSSSIIR